MRLVEYLKILKIFSFVESRYPGKLLAHLKKVRKFVVAEISPGIYNIVGDILPIQIINSCKLSAEDNVWLKSLRNKLNYSDIEQITFRIAQKGKEVQIEAYTYAIVYANSKIIEEKIMIREVPLELERAFEKAGLIAKWEAKGETKERQKWTSVVADKDAKLADNAAEIAVLRAQLEAKTK